MCKKPFSITIEHERPCVHNVQILRDTVLIISHDQTICDSARLWAIDRGKSVQLSDIETDCLGECICLAIIDRTANGIENWERTEMSLEAAFAGRVSEQIPPILIIDFCFEKSRNDIAREIGIAPDKVIEANYLIEYMPELICEELDKLFDQGVIL